MSESYLVAIILGIVEGLTEFLPIASIAPVCMAISKTLAFSLV